MPPRSVPLWRQRRVQATAAFVAGLAVVGVAGALILGGSSGSDDDSKKSASGRTSTTRDDGPTSTTEPPPIAPLTGLPDPSLATLVRPVLAVKIDNVALEIRPDQAGLDIADVVYEEPVEFATRFVAMFHSQAADRAGPVRSTRMIDPGIMWAIHGLYVYSGGTPPKVSAIETAPVQTLDETDLVAADAHIRDPGIPAPHNLFVIPDSAWAAAQDRTPPAPLFVYRAEGRPFRGEPAASVEIPSYSQARYTWDATSGTWLREEVRGSGSGREPHMAESGEQIAPTNLIVQKIASTEDKSNLVGEGDAWVFSDGRVVRGRWVRTSLEERTSFLDGSGAELRLTPGTTWVHLITSDEPVIAAG